MLTHRMLSRFFPRAAQRRAGTPPPSQWPSHTRLRADRYAPRPSSGIESYMMKPVTSEMELEAERISVPGTRRRNKDGPDGISRNIFSFLLGLATAMTTWLDEEWTSLPEHQKLGQAAAEAYVGLRRRGENDLGSVVLALASELLRPELAATFRASFTDPFEVSNKLVETVMLLDGCDVCCTSPSDRDRIQRVNELLSSGSSGSLE